MLSKQNSITIVVLAGILAVLSIVTYFIRRDSGTIPYEETPAYAALETPEGVQPYTDINGEEVSLIDAKPKKVLVYSWASWCVDCKEQLQELNVYAGGLNASEIRVIAVNRKENSRAARRFLDTVPSLPNIEIILDPDDYLFTEIEGYAVPEVILYDEDGSVVLHERNGLRIGNIQAALATEGA